MIPKDTTTIICTFSISFFGKNKLCYLINQDTIYAYILYMKNTLKVTDSTINIRLRAMRAFFNFCSNKGYMDRINFDFIKIKDKNFKIPYTDNEIKKLLKIPDLCDCNKIQSFTRLRNWVITNLN